MHRLISNNDSEENRPLNPRKNANIFEIFTFSWLLGLFKIGQHRDLNENDLYQTLDEYSSSLLGDELEKIWKSEMSKASKANREPSLLRALIRMFGVRYMFCGLLCCTNEMTLKILQPIFIGELLLYFNPTDSSATNSGYKYLYASGLLLIMFISIICYRLIYSEILSCGLKMRTACCSVVFRKVLRLSHASLGKTTIGQVINLVSNDIKVFDATLVYVHYLWIGPLQMILVTYLLWPEVGIFSLLGVATLLFFIPLQGWLGKAFSNQRQKSILKTDERIRLMNEIISGIQLIKMYTWEKSFARLIYQARKKEIQLIAKLSYTNFILKTFKEIQSRIQLFVIIITYVLLGNYITTQKVYVIISFYNLLSSSMSSWFVLGMTGVTELKISIRRIQALLLLEEKDSLMSKFLNYGQEETSGLIELSDCVKTVFETKYRTQNINDFSIDICDATAKWADCQTSYSLENINLTVKPGELITIIGPVGAGKSSLMQLILRELLPLKGSVSVRGVISYASQESWIFAGSIQQNILFDSPMDIDRYREVIEICALKSDFDEFPDGDKTIVGERGVTLSGGQRARINLARAVYKQADIYLLDDPLSAVDVHVGKCLFEKCIKNYLKGKTCLLVTHQLYYLPNVDQIVLLEKANISAKGTYQELQASSFDFSKSLGLPEEISNECDDTATIKNNTSDTHYPLGSRQITPSNVESKRNDCGVLLKEKNNNHSSVKTAKGYVAYFTAGGNVFRIIIFFSTYVFAQTVITGGDYWLSFWVNQEDYVFRNMNNMSFENSTLMGRGSSDFFMLQSNPRQLCIIVYVILVILMVVFSHIKVTSSVSFCMRASERLHNTLFNSIIYSTLRFFDSTSSGHILNYFSNDIGNIDNNLRHVLCESIQVFFRILGIVIIISIVNSYLIIPTIVIGIICYFLRNFFVPISRSFKRLTSTTQSPLFSHITESFRGLATIRAFHVEQMLSKEFDKHQDLNSSSHYLDFSSNLAFGTWLDITCFIYTGIVIFSFLVVENNLYGGYVGLAITQSMRLIVSVQWGLKQLTQLESQMHSVERVLEFTNIPQEANIQSAPDEIQTKEWPKSGEIVFQNLNLRYSTELPYALKNINLKIQPMEKIGIVGRTGAGKSSIISALFRLAINEGIIMIDGIEIHDLGLHDLRSKLSVIPQEPVLFCGTIRSNLDPFDEYPDHVLWNALNEVELKTVIENSVGGLNSKMSESGSNFSVGQRQLFCLARAIIRNNKILVLDEATANVDPQTDALIQITIRNKFKKCTVLTIAHRLNTIMDSDKVAVMEAGSIVEFDHPYNLLNNKDGFLYKMVEKMGQASAGSLKTIASENFMAMQMKRESSIKMIDDNEEIE